MLARAGNVYTPANEADDGTTWRNQYGHQQWKPDNHSESRTGVYNYNVIIVCTRDSMLADRIIYNLYSIYIYKEDCLTLSQCICTVFKIQSWNFVVRLETQWDRSLRGYHILCTGHTGVINNTIWLITPRNVNPACIHTVNKIKRCITKFLHALNPSTSM